MSYESPWERLTEAVLRYADAETDEAFAREKDNLRKSALNYATWVAYRHDPEVRAYVRRVRAVSSIPGQLGLWPVRVRGIESVTVATCMVRTA